MGNRLEGKRVLVTAAGQGIGRASALLMAAEGATVIATDVNPALLESYQGVANVQATVLDVLKDDEVARVVGGGPALDVLFNCAGYVHQGTIFECTDRDWDFSFGLNVRAQWKTIAAALPKMIERGGGSIINMASMCSSLKGFPNRFVYGASKAAVIGLTKSIAADYVAKGIRCNCICPGTITTEGTRATWQREDPRETLLPLYPLGRYGTPDEIARCALFLASDQSSLITGAVLVADGGLTANVPVPWRAKP